MRLTHVALSVRDLDTSIAFYRDYCGMEIVHDRGEDDHRVVWLSEPGREHELIFVLMTGRPTPPQSERDYRHLGFAVEARETVDEIAARADAEGRLCWPPREEPFPVGYFCGVRDPDGQVVEFSFGQPLGPGAP
ncbi:MAG: VOC family protein [Polyangiaceae bacterium]